MTLIARIKKYKRGNLWLLILSSTPIFMFLFNKSAAALFTIAALSRYIESPHRTIKISRADLAVRLDPEQRKRIALVATFVFCVGSILWAPDPWRSLDILAGALIVLLAGFTVARLGGADERGTMRDGAFLVLIVCSAAIIVEEASGMKLHRLLGGRSESFALKRTVLCDVVLFAGLLGFARVRYRPWVIVVASLLQAGAIVAAHSGAAAFGALGFLAAGALHRLCGPRAVKAAILTGVAGCLALAPFVGTLGEHGRDGHVVRSLQAFHLKERIEIWKAFGTLVRERPIVGHGFGPSQHIVGPLAAPLRPAPALDVVSGLHPHNAYLQIWVEFGACGVVAALAIMSGFVASMDSASDDFDVRSGLVMGCCFVMLLSHSLWQPWWIASLAAAATWLRIGEGPPSAVPDRVAPAHGPHSVFRRALLRRTGVRFGREQPGASIQTEASAVLGKTDAGRTVSCSVAGPK